MTLVFICYETYIFYNILKIGFRPTNIEREVTLEVDRIMYISHQTLERLKISVNSLRKAIKFLLQNEITNVLTERFFQVTLDNRSRAFTG